MRQGGQSGNGLPIFFGGDVVLPIANVMSWLAAASPWSVDFPSILTVEPKLRAWRRAQRKTTALSRQIQSQILRCGALAVSTP